MRKQKILIVLFAGSLVLPGVVWAGFSSRFDMENNENRKLAEFPEVNLGALETSRSSLRRIIRIMCPSKMTW